jgi:hypothetical protein
MKRPIVYASMALAILLAVCVLLATQFRCEDSLGSSGVLHNEDFGTGLLRSDLRMDQVELITAWARERGFERCDADQYGEMVVYSFEREDGLWLSYSFFSIMDSGHHSLSIMLLGKGAVAEKPEHIRGVPTYMMPGVSREDVEEKLGSGISLGPSESENIGDVFARSETIVYHEVEAEGRRVRTNLYCVFVDGRARNVTLRIGMGVAMPPDGPYDYEPYGGTPWPRLPTSW